MLSSYSALALALVAASSASALTPEGSIPVVNATLGVAYNQTVIDGTQLFEPALLQTQPNVSYVPEMMMMNETAPTNATSNGTYMLLMVDLSLPITNVRLPDASIVRGASSNDSTRLHFWQGNLTSVDMSAAMNSTASNLTNAFTSFLTSASAPVASYQGPAPPAGDGPHYYTFYLFNQPENYTLPASAVSRNFSGYGDGRANFNITPVIEAAGEPLAATYLQAENGAMGITVTNQTAVANATVA